MTDAVPFEITEQGETRIASNGDTSLTLLDADGKLFRRRGVRGLNMKPCGESALPLLNELAGELLAKLDMPAHVLAQRLAGISAAVQPVPSETIEWAVAELDGVRIYMTGKHVLVTRQDLRP